MFDGNVALYHNSTAQMLSPVSDEAECLMFNNLLSSSLKWLFIWLNVLVPCGGKRYVCGNMLLNLMMFSQWEAKIWSDIHASTHRGSHSLNNCCILLSDCICWVIFCEQRIGSLGALEMCLWFPLLPNEIWYALLLQISVEFTTCKKWFCRLDFYLERWSTKRYGKKYWMPAFSHSHALSSDGFQVKSVCDKIPYCSCQSLALEWDPTPSLWKRGKDLGVRFL